MHFCITQDYNYTVLPKYLLDFPESVQLEPRFHESFHKLSKIDCWNLGSLL